MILEERLETVRKTNKCKDLIVRPDDKNAMEYQPLDVVSLIPFAKYLNERVLKVVAVLVIIIASNIL